MAEWQAVMSSHEFAEWLAFFRVQPYGEWREDFRMSNLMALIANVNRDPKKSKEFTPQDFMPDFEQALDEMDAQEEIPEHERVWNKVKAAFGGLVNPPAALAASPHPSTAASTPPLRTERGVNGDE